MSEVPELRMTTAHRVPVDGTGGRAAVVRGTLVLTSRRLLFYAAGPAADAGASLEHPGAVAVGIDEIAGMDASVRDDPEPGVDLVVRLAAGPVLRFTSTTASDIGRADRWATTLARLRAEAIAS